MPLTDMNLKAVAKERKIWEIISCKEIIIVLKS